MTAKQQEEETIGNAQAILNHMKENPLLYIGSVSIIVVVTVSTLLFRLNDKLQTRDQASTYVTAVDIEDSTERMEALGEITDGKSKFMAEALYMQGHAAIESEDYETAKVALTTLREKHPDFEFTPDGVEGLGTIHELSGNYDEAIAVYKDIQATWPESFAARRQPFNIGRCHEENDNPAEALKAFQEQLQTFPESNVALHAQQKIDQLESANPALAQAPEIEGPAPVAPSDAL